MHYHRPDYNRRTVAVVTAPAAPVIPLDEAKAFLRVDGPHDDLIIAQLIGAAYDAAVRYTARSLLPTGLRLTLDGPPGANRDALDMLGEGMHEVSVPHLVGGREIELPRGPVTAVDLITVYFRDGSSDTFDAANWFLDNAGDRLVLEDGAVWPTDLRRRGALRIDYTAGFDTLPEPVRTAILQHLTVMYECRTACEMPDGCKGLLSSYRRLDGLAW
jgi:hypothetical protein